MNPPRAVSDPSTVPVFADTGAPARRPGQERLIGIEVLRGVAASVVVFHHLAWVVGHFHEQPSALIGFHGLANVGAAGVDIFFCISGLVIGRSGANFAAGGSAAASFVMKRLTRVLSLYWLLTTALVLLWALGLAMRDVFVTPGLLIASYLLIPYPKASTDGTMVMHPLLDVGWTLTFEMYFYGICTIVIWAWGGRRLFPMAPIALLVPAAIAFVALAPSDNRGGVIDSPLLVEFALGLLLARFGDRLAPVAGAGRQRIALALMFAGALGLIASIFLRDPVPVRMLCWGLPGAIVVWGAMLLNFNGTKNTMRRLVVYLGTASYTIYLAHPFITLSLGRLLKVGWFQRIDSDVLLVGATVITVLATSATYPFIERPLLRRLSRPLRRAA